MKDRCANGHENPCRTARRQCIECRVESNRRRKRAAPISFAESCALVNALRHFLYGFDDLPWEARCGSRKLQNRGGDLIHSMREVPS